MLPKLLKPPFELSHFFRQISHLAGILATCLFPGILCGIKGLSRLVYGATILHELRHSKVSWVVKGPSAVLHHLQYLAERPFLGAPLSESPLCARFLGTCSAALEAVVALVILAWAFSFVHSTQVGDVTR